MRTRLCAAELLWSSFWLFTPQHMDKARLSLHLGFCCQTGGTRLLREEFTPFSVSCNKNPSAEGSQPPALIEALAKCPNRRDLQESCLFAALQPSPPALTQPVDLKPIACSLPTLGWNSPRPWSPLEETPSTCLVAVLALGCSG